MVFAMAMLLDAAMAWRMVSTVSIWWASMCLELRYFHVPRQTLTVSSMSTLPSSRATIIAMGLKVEPGSTRLTAWFCIS